VGIAYQGKRLSLVEDKGFLKLFADYVIGERRGVYFMCCTTKVFRRGVLDAGELYVAVR
jgi:hypothetical protein